VGGPGFAQKWTLLGVENFLFKLELSAFVWDLGMNVGFPMTPIALKLLI
jgi:hypothetical protein